MGHFKHHGLESSTYIVDFWQGKSFQLVVRDIEDQVHKWLSRPAPTSHHTQKLTQQDSTPTREHQDYNVRKTTGNTLSHPGLLRAFSQELTAWTQAASAPLLGVISWDQHGRNVSQKCHHCQEGRPPLQVASYFANEISRIISTE